MGKLSNFNGSTYLASGITKRSGSDDFPLVEAHDVLVDSNGTRLDEALSNLGAGSSDSSTSTETPLTALELFIKCTCESDLYPNMQIQFFLTSTVIVPYKLKTISYLDALADAMKDIYDRGAPVPTAALSGGGFLYDNDTEQYGNNAEVVPLYAFYSPSDDSIHMRYIVKWTNGLSDISETVLETAEMFICQCRALNWDPSISSGS